MEVICSCNKERVDTQEVELLNIEEGPAGEDRMTFTCPFCGHDHTSVVIASIEEANGDFWKDQLADEPADYWAVATYSTPADLEP